MAKITIELRDTPLGRVHVTCDPPMEVLRALEASGAEKTEAQEYAIRALVFMQSESDRARGIAMPKAPLAGRH